MIRLSGINAIEWEREDVRLMAKILGAEHAIIPKKRARGWAPPVMSILKLAAMKGALMSRSAKIALDEAEAQYRDVAAMKRWDDQELREPRATQFFKHQRADLAMMYALQLPGWLIASEAGVGKTIVAIRYVEHIKADRIMLIVPNAAKDQWAEEIGRWGTRKLPITIVNGSVKQQIEQIADTPRGWIIGHWESLVWGRPGWRAHRWNAAIVDEIQYMQNRNAQRTATLFKIKADVRIAMGAHPYANGVSELFPVLKFLYPDLYPSFWRWAGMHIDIQESYFGGLDLRAPRRPKLLNWEIAPFTIRRLWKDVWPNLPPITRSYRTIELTATGQREYKKLKKQFFVELAAHRGEKKILAIPSVLARITRLRQYLVDPGILGAKEKSVKYPVVHDLIRELRGRPPVIFTMWRKSALRLQAYLEQKKKLVVPVIVGGMTSKQINRIKRQFREGQFDAVIIMIKVGGTALNFGKYGALIYLDHPWNQRDVEQTEGRVRRPEEGSGKLVPTTSYHLIVKDSHEERMFQQRSEKHSDFRKVFTVADAIEWFDDEPSIEL